MEAGEMTDLLTNEAAAALLRAYVEDMKASGFVAQALQRHGIQGASVAPAQA